MARYDLENFRDDIIGLIQANLPAKVIEINTEKADGNDIQDIPANLYYDNVNGQVWNEFPFVYYGYYDVQTETVGSRTSLKPTMFLSVVFCPTNDNTSIENKALRYSRAFMEIIEENFKFSCSVSQLNVLQFTPEDFTTNDGSDFKIAGVHVTGTIVG